MVDYSFLNLTPSALIPPDQTLDVDFNNKISEVDALYRFGPNNPWQLLAGVRNYKLDIDVKLVGPGTNVNKSLTDFVIGVRYLDNLSKKWSLVARTDLGTGDSDQTWQALVAFDYRFNELLSGLLGYRSLDYDVDETNFKFKVTHIGPLAFHW